MTASSNEDDLPDPPDLPDLPAELGAAHARWCEQGRRPQDPITVPADRWRAAFPQHELHLAGLPDRLDRAQVSATFEQLDESNVLTAFFAVMAWGNGKTGYSRYRVGMMFRDSDAAHILRTLTAAARLARSGEATGAFVQLRDQGIKHFGPAFATKFIYFAGRAGRDSEAPLPPLILDSQIRTWLRCPGKVTLAPHWAVDYDWYLHVMAYWARLLGERPETVEQLIFLDQASRG